MPYTSITPGSTAMQEAKNTMVTSWLHQCQGLGRQFHLQNTKHIAAQNYLCNVHKPPVMFTKPCHLNGVLP